MTTQGVTRTSEPFVHYTIGKEDVESGAGWNPASILERLQIIIILAVLELVQKNLPENSNLGICGDLW